MSRSPSPIPKASEASRQQIFIALGALVGIVGYLVSHYGFAYSNSAFLLIAVILLGGIPLLLSLAKKAWAGEFGADFLAGISICTALLLQEYLAGAIIVLMLAGGEALESFAMRRASSVLDALARRMPYLAHRQSGKDLIEVPTEEVRVGDRIVIFPHELCPVDGVVVEGEGTMDESFLTGEPFLIAKTTGSDVISGAINGESALTIQASRVAVDSRYAKIMKVMQEADQNRPAMRRLGDMLGAYYTPLALVVAGLAYLISGDPSRFLAVLVVATPCPLLLAIPISIIGSISLAAKRGIVVKRPAALEQLSSCRSIIFDKTGTLTYGKPELTEILPAAGFTSAEVLAFAASVERYSKHPLSSAILQKAHQQGLSFISASEISEKPGRGLQGIVSGRSIEITSRSKFLKRHVDAENSLPAQTAGLECVVLVDDVFAGLCKFRDSPRLDSKSFVDHLAPKHSFKSVMLVSGDRESEVRYLAERVGITQVYANQSPEDKVAIVRRESEKGGTLFIGDGINDAPAIAAATVGIAFGQGSEILTEAADAVIMEPNLSKVDELFHIAYRMRHIALQSAIGGMALSIVGMGFAVSGHLSPVAGAIAQEVIDLLAVLNAIRVAVPPTELTDFSVVSQTKT